MDGIHTGAELWHIGVAAVGFYGIVWRTWLVPMRKEREELIAWRRDQEATDAAHETRFRAIEGRLDRGDARFDQINGKLDQILQRITAVEEQVKAHRQAQE